MRKVYLLITTALLLLGSSTLWAESSGTASVNGESMSIRAAISTWLKNGGELTLETTCVLDTTAKLNVTKTATLNLNNHSLEIKTSAQYGFYLYSPCLLTITDVENGNGALSINSTSSSATYLLYAGSQRLSIIRGQFSAFNSNGSTCSSVYATNTNTSILGGTFNAKINTGTGAVGIISGGKFNPKPKYYTATDNKVFKLMDGYYQLAEGSYFASISDIGYCADEVEQFNADLSSVSTSRSAVNIFANYDVTIPAGKYVTLKQISTKQNNGTITNNGDIILPAGNNVPVWESGSFVNNGEITMKGGIFKDAVYYQLRSVGAEVDASCTAFKYYLEDGYKQILTTSTVYATVSVGEDVMGFTSLPIALNYSSESSPAVLAKSITGALSVSNGEKKYLNLNNFTLTLSSSASINGGLLDISGQGTISCTNNTGAFVVYGAIEDVANYSVLNIGKDVTVNAQNGWGAGIFSKEYGNNVENQKKAFGVVLNISGTINAPNGLTINGNVSQLSGNVPVINIADGAILKAYGDGVCTNEACIYAAGYGIWNIGAATLKANTPIYAKAGIININGADIEACGDFSEPEAYSGGFYPTGDAIIMDTHKSYAGNMILNITNDDTEIKSTHGYAIHEAMTKAASTDASSAIGLTIQGIALIEGGDAVGAGNATKFTDRFTQALKDGSDGQYHWVLNGVSGGRYTSEPSVVAPGYESTYNSVTGYWEVHPQSTPVPSKLYTIIEDTEWPATDLADNSEVLIKTGATLTVPSISVEDGSVITVEPGAKLIAGENGIITASPSGLILKADEANGTGVVLFDGTVSNKQPQGTVELYLVAKKIDDSNYVWQHFGIPTTSAPTITRIEPVSYKDWDVKQGWIYTSGSASLTAPWVGHNVTTSAIAEGNIISFAGTLVGMTDATLNLSQTGYNCLSNSFTAPISVESFVSGIDRSLTTDGMVWIYDPKIDDFITRNFSSFDVFHLPDVFMPSMQGFFLLNRGASPIEVSLPYSNVETTAGLKSASAYNGGIISLSNGATTSTLQIIEGDEFSDEFENSYDGYQMPTGNIQIYAIQGTDKLASIATNKIDGKEIEIVTTAGTEYSLSFSNLLGNAFKLKDLLTGDEIEVSEDNVYRFTAEPNSTLRRFKISEGEVSADEADADAVKVWVAESSLNIAGAVEGDAIEVINLAGVKVLSATATGVAVQAISLNDIASGAYIVKAGAATVKVIK